MSAALWWAIQLSRDLDTCRQLLRGEPVDPDTLDPNVLRRAQALDLVTLDIKAIELFEHWPTNGEVRHVA